MYVVGSGGGPGERGVIDFLPQIGKSFQVEGCGVPHLSLQGGMEGKLHGQTIADEFLIIMIFSHCVRPGQARLQKSKSGVECCFKCFSPTR